LSDRNDKVNVFVLIMLLLSLVSLFIENGLIQTRVTRLFTNTLDYVVYLMFLLDVVTAIAKSKHKISYVRRNVFDVCFLVVFSALFIYTKYTGFLSDSRRAQSISTYLIILRNVFVFVKTFDRVRKLHAFVSRIARHPAQTMLFGFLSVIVVGSLLLMTTFSSVGGKRIGFVDSLFTATSAVCVTGLIVVDTATRFTLFGEIVILCLIQIGGLGIMILSFFTLFLFGKKATVQGQFLMSYMLDEKDMTALSGTVKSIVLMTFSLEFAGFLLLTVVFGFRFGYGLNTLFLSLFHSVSAFCNAGFSLFSDNLAGFTGDMPLNFTVTLLIILGGIGFPVINNLFASGKKMMTRFITGKRERILPLSLNTKVVLLMSGALVLSGLLLTYALEHGNALIRYDMKTQYLTSFFQSVTLRTAGFNTIDFTRLNRSTYLLMALFMFIGGASGSTAGGVKVNTIAIVGGYVRSIVRNRDEVTIFDQSIAGDTINKALFILLLYTAVIFTGTLLLTIIERFEPVSIFFEVVSAMGTVGLSAGITSSLSAAGKVIIVALMFIGRVGPLTVIASLARKKKGYPMSYPQGNIAIG
jgi:trk system potassium uptake protein